MRILLTGINGQVGFELVRSLQGLGKVFSADRSKLDLADPDQIRKVIRDIKPSLIVNPAAYTAVDKAETDSDLAMQVNGIAPGIMAEEAARIGASMIHYSTDYVFDGSKAGTYNEADLPCPANVYGKTKLAGELAIEAANIPYLIFRTSWVYSTHGNNFLKTMLRLAKERKELRVVADQIGAPTWSRTIAEATAHVIARSTVAESDKVEFVGPAGIYHLTAQGETSWHGFAEAIFQTAGISDMVVLPIRSSDYPVPAARPKNSRLSSDRFIKHFFSLPCWREALNMSLER